MVGHVDVFVLGSTNDFSCRFVQRKENEVRALNEGPIFPGYWLKRKFYSKPQSEVKDKMALIASEWLA